MYVGLGHSGSISLLYSREESVSINMNLSSSLLKCSWLLSCPCRVRHATGDREGKSVY